MSDNGVRLPAMLIFMTLVLWILNSLGFLTVSIGGGNTIYIGFTVGLILLLIANWLLFVYKGRNIVTQETKNDL